MRTLFGIAAILLLLSSPSFAQLVQLTDGASTTPWIAVGATESAVVWHQGQQRVNAAVLDRSGSVMTPPFDVGPMGVPMSPVVAAAGDTFLAVWPDVDASGSSNIRAAVFDRTGVRQPPFTLATTARGDIAAGGSATRFFVAWFDGSASYGAWVNTAGVVESTFKIIDRAAVTDVVVAGDTAVVSWSDSFDDASGVPRLAAGVTAVAGTTVLASRTIATMPGQGGFGSPYLYNVSIASNGTGYCVAWHSGRSGREDVVEGTRLLPDLTPLDVDPSQADGHHAGATSIQSDYTSPQKRLIRVSSAGERYFVSWIQTNPITDMIKGRYIESSGAPSGYVSFPQPRPLSAPYETVVTGMTTLLQNGTPMSVWEMTSGRLFVRVVGGPRLRPVRR